jgi:hypothetical protein
MNIDRLRKVPLRELWPHEVHNFMAWMCENLDLLTEPTGLELSLVEREAAAALFVAQAAEYCWQSRQTWINTGRRQWRSNRTTTIPLRHAA